MVGYMIHARNAAAMWWALADGHGELLAWTRQVRILQASPYHALRAIVLDAGATSEETMERVRALVLPRADLPRRIVEDPSGTLDLQPYGFEPRFRMTVMLRPPGAVGAPARDEPGLVSVARDTETLGIAERVIAAVFPPARVEADMFGRTMPSRVLDIPGWQVWLGRRSDVPAGAAYTYHDGESLGVYQVATLPEHRYHGVARSVMESILAAHADVPVTLTATDQGRPLYESLGFHAISEAVWWAPSPSGCPIG
ncbi:GNAT family N-acetyltransferase [Rugosimonospora africana]|uniref:N-acetyltransferase domain-containing protein n=1 Tax=Rugosimonospora africana TaxID=556532 RepID=A0A8J3QLL9_9ACTN|nr:GNAT family N-acetyltransferase [Rugosimonospora africana]GIH13214.1 hypothetical protein Raf01_13860 [Rugosimonospora africana]